MRLSRKFRDKSHSIVHSFLRMESNSIQKHRIEPVQSKLLDTTCSVPSVFFCRHIFHEQQSMNDDSIRKSHNALCVLQMTLMPGIAYDTARHFSINRQNFHETDICQLPFCPHQKWFVVHRIVSNCIFHCRSSFVVLVSWFRSTHGYIFVFVITPPLVPCAGVEQMNILRCNVLFRFRTEHAAAQQEKKKTLRHSVIRLLHWQQVFFWPFERVRSQHLYMTIYVYFLFSCGECANLNIHSRGVRSMGTFTVAANKKKLSIFITIYNRVNDFIKFKRLFYEPYGHYIGK